MITRYLADVQGTSQLLITGSGILEGMYVASTSAGTIKFIDGIASGGTTMINTITPAIGYHNLGSIRFYNGLYVATTQTINTTVLVRIENV